MKVASKSLTITLGLGLVGVSSYLLYLLLKKDDDEEDNYTDTFTKASKFKVHQFPVPNDSRSMIIGRAGRNIRQIQEQSNTRINFQDCNDQSDQAICIVKGSSEACQIAENLINECIRSQPIYECMDMWVPTNCTGRLIGQDGGRIKEMSIMSGARINVDRNVGQASRRVAIRGTKDQIKVAKGLIEEVVEEFERGQVRLEANLAKREPRLPLKNGVESLNGNSPRSERMSPIPGQTDAQFEVYVSAMVDPSRFWLQIVGPKATQLDVLVDEMTVYYRDSENRYLHLLQKVEKGDLVAAIFKYDDKWYRAEVLNLVTENAEVLAELYYVDYGDTDLVPIEEVFELRTDFLRLHFQAIECFLARVEPADGGWSVEAVDKFEEWTHVAQWQKLSAKINGYSTRERTRAKREGSPVPGVDLFDVNNERDVDIAEELVKAGFATFKKDVDLRTSSRATSNSNLSVASSS